MAADPYSILGVSPGCTEEELKTAYRRLAKQYHPDLHPNDAAAAARMNEINAAYEQIKNGRTSAYTAYNSANQSYGSAYQSYGGQTTYQHSGFDPFGAGQDYRQNTNSRQYYTYSYRRGFSGGWFIRLLLILFLLRLLFTLFFGSIFMSSGGGYTQHGGSTPYYYYYYSYPDDSYSYPDSSSQPPPFLEGPENGTET